MWSKGVLDYDSRVCCFKEVKTTAKILLILAFQKPEIQTNKYIFGLIIYASLRTLAPNF